MIGKYKKIKQHNLMLLAKEKELIECGFLTFFGKSPAKRFAINNLLRYNVSCTYIVFIGE